MEESPDTGGASGSGGGGALRERAQASASEERVELPFEEVAEEVPPPRMVRRPYGPTAAEREEHECLGHVVYREWCRHCVAARGIGQKHRTIEHTEGEPEVTLDYGFLGEDDGKCMPMLVILDRQTKSVAATFVDAKGCTPYAVKFVRNFYRSLGYRRLVAKSDGERAIVALKLQAAKEAQVEAVPKESPEGDSKANGAIEVCIREIKRQIRVMRSVLEEKLGKQLSEGDAVLRWLPRHAADLISRYKRGYDGRTAEQRRTGRAWKRPLVQLGERMMFRPVGLSKLSTYEGKMLEGRYVGHHARTGALLALTSDGLKAGTGVRRLTEDERWSTNGWEQLKGLPWDVATRAKPEAPEKPIAVGPESRPLEVRPAPEDKPSQVRRMYVLKADIERYGATDGCPGCAALAGDGGVVDTTHNDTCRERILKLMESDESRRGRLDRLRTREQAAEKPKEAEVEAEDASGAPKGRRRKMNAVPARDAERKRKAEDELEGPITEEAEVVVQPAAVESSAQDASTSAAAKTEVSRGTSSKRTADQEAEELRTETAGQDVEDLVERVMRAPATTTAAAPEASSSSSANAPPAQPNPDDGVDIDSLEVIEDGLMDQLKVELYPFIEGAVKDVFAFNRVDVSHEEVKSITKLSLELGTVDVAEIYNPERFTERCNDLGLRPGFAMDLETGWDLRDPEQVKELMWMLKEEDPIVLIGSPPCTWFSPLQNISKHKRDAADLEAQEAEAMHHLKVATGAYKEQHLRGRYFLHEHPAAASSWKTDPIKEVEALHGVRNCARAHVQMGACEHRQERWTHWLRKKRDQMDDQLPRTS